MNGNIRNRCMAHAALAARELPLSMRSQEFRRNVQAKCFRHDVRPTSAAKRCDAREESGTQQVRALAVTPKAESYRPDEEASKSALLVEESEPSALSVVTCTSVLQRRSTQRPVNRLSNSNWLPIPKQSGGKKAD